MTETELINKDELIYWVDKSFVQETAKERIGRELSEGVIKVFTKMIEIGLSDAVWISTTTAIDYIAEEEET